MLWLCLLWRDFFDLIFFSPSTVLRLHRLENKRFDPEEEMFLQNKTQEDHFSDAEL